MEPLDLLRRQLSAVRWAWDAMLDHLTEDQMNWQPPGTCNSIAATMLHVFGVEDDFVSRKLGGLPTLWERDGWSGAIGLAEFPDLGNGWAGTRGRRLAIGPIMAYGQAVRAATDGCLAGMAPAELDREIEMGGSPRPAADLLSTLAIHIISHGGEIAVLKGLQGLQGQPI